MPRAGKDQLAHILLSLHHPGQTLLIHHSTLSPEPERNLGIRLHMEPQRASLMDSGWGGGERRPRSLEEHKISCALSSRPSLSCPTIPGNLWMLHSWSGCRGRLMSTLKHLEWGGPS